MMDGKAAQLLRSLAITPEAELGIQAMLEVLASGMSAEVASRINVAHTAMFYGVGGFDTASPYRSVYSSERGLLCQKETAEMERVLRQHRLRLDDKVKEPSDHLSIQLEVMAQLALRFAEAAQQGSNNLTTLQEEQADFLSNQLLTWLPTFVRRVVEVDTLGFHAGLVCVLLGFLESDREFLTEPSEYPLNEALFTTCLQPIGATLT
jgi:TorA maturation chaperone TorD